MARLAVLGHPVAHSRSPRMQEAALAELGLAEDWSYEAIDVAPEGFEDRAREMAAEGFAGANVTVPHKRAALALADAPSEVAREIGAANTLVFAAGAVLWALEREGAAVEVWNRTPQRAEEICAELGGRPVLEPDPAGYELIVNTSAAGLGGGDPFADLPLSPGGFETEQTVVDLVYGEEPSPLLGAAAAAGAATVDGIEVLVQQGALSLRIWTGREPPVEAMRAAAYRS